jgi:predicted nucleic acid-binding protein
MSGFLLDTNVPSETLRPRPDANVSAWLNRQAQDAQFLSVGHVAHGCLVHGAPPCFRCGN